MTYRVEYTTSAAKQLAKLDRGIARKIADVIGALATEPRPIGYTKLVGSDSLRVRIGDYRVVYLVTDEVLTVTVIRVGHRRDVYER